MSTRIQLRNGTATEWLAANPVLARGEMGVEIDTGKTKIGDGTQNWVSLPYTTADLEARLEALESSGVATIPGTVVVNRWTGVAWPARPTAPGIVVDWEGPTFPTTGMLTNDRFTAK